jgi:hypothetical protein
MKIAVCFYGLLYGDSFGRDYDVRHCWPNISRMILEPLKVNHTVDVLLSTYTIDDASIETEVRELIKPNYKHISSITNSNSRTTKLGIFQMLESIEKKDYDFVIMTRADLHFSKSVVDMNMNYDKFNFLFHEDHQQKYLTCDNFYAWPYKITKEVGKSFEECRALNKHDTHQLYDTLSKNIPVEDIHYISGEEKHLSDVNKYFTICKPGYGNDRIDHGMHEDVIKRFDYKK